MYSSMTCNWARRQAQAELQHFRLAVKPLLLLGLLCWQGLVKMRAACKLAAEVLNYAGTLVRPGVTTEEIDRLVHDMIVSRGAYPSPLNYGKFPKSVCTSVNECMCHGIPDGRWAPGCSRQQLSQSSLDRPKGCQVHALLCTQQVVFSECHSPQPMAGSQAQRLFLLMQASSSRCWLSSRTVVWRVCCVLSGCCPPGAGQ